MDTREQEDPVKAFRDDVEMSGYTGNKTRPLKTDRKPQKSSIFSGLTSFSGG